MVASHQSFELPQIDLKLLEENGKQNPKKLRQR